MQHVAATSSCHYIAHCIATASFCSCTLDGTATPVMIYDPLLSSDKLYEVVNSSLVWQGIHIM